MVQRITNYTTYDLAYYYADLTHLPRLSREHRQQLTAALRQAPRGDREARNRLIEGHLKLVTHLAIARCPSTHYRLLPDILGEVAFTLVKTADRYDFEAGNDFTSYAVACTDAAVRHALGSDRLIRVPSSTLYKARQQGTEQRFYDLQPESLDEWMHWYNTDELEEPPTTPLLPTHEAPPRDPMLRAQVQEWFSYLSPRAQQVLTLRYGLADEDERCLTPTQVAQELGLKPTTVRSLERDAKQKIKALVEGTATLVERNGKRRIHETAVFHPPLLTPEQEASFLQLSLHFCEQQIKVSARLLAKETGKSIHLARVFLRLHRDQLPYVTSAKHTDTRQQRLAHVAQVYADLIAQGKRVSIKGLARAAHVRNDLAEEFMHAQRRERDAAQAR